MTTSVAIQSVSPKSVQSAESSTKTASSQNTNEIDSVESKRKSSFKEVYDDASKMDKVAETETKTTELDDAAADKTLTEDGNSLPPENKQIDNTEDQDTSLSALMATTEDDGNDALQSDEQLAMMDMSVETVVDNNIVIGVGEPAKEKLMLSGIDKQSLDKAGKETVSVLTGLNPGDAQEPDASSAEQNIKQVVNDKAVNNIATMMPALNAKSLAQGLSQTKNSDGLGNTSSMKDTLALSPAQLTDDLMMGDMDKVLNKVATNDKLSLEAMLGKLDILANTTSSNHKQNSVIPLSTALNYSSTSITQDLSSGHSQVTISETLGKPEWNQSMSKQISWMASQNIRSAEIKLTPANLGTIEVRVDMNDDKLNVGFSSRDAGVRDSLEQTMPKLREMMEDQGLNLGDANVSEQALFEQQDERFLQQEGFTRNIENKNRVSVVDTVSSEDSVVRTVSASMTAVDYYI